MATRMMWYSKRGRKKDVQVVGTDIMCRKHRNPVTRLYRRFPRALALVLGERSTLGSNGEHRGQLLCFPNVIACSFVEEDTRTE